MADEKKVLPWERQEGEPDDAFNNFRYYRDMPMPRKVLGVMHGSTTDKWEWSSKWSWISRAKQYDDHISNLAIQEREETVRMAARDIQVEHLMILHGMRELLMREAGKWLRRSRETEGMSELRINELVKLTESVVKLERLALGETTENTQPVTRDLSKLSVEELYQLQELTEKAGL